MRNEVFAKLAEICRDVFEDEELIITESTTAADVERWDSLTHLSLINELEEAYEVAFTLDEVTGSKNLGELLNALMKHIEEKQGITMMERRFSDKHIWVEGDGASIRIGITDYAQEKLGTIMFLNLPEMGDRVEIGQRFGDIESIKNVSDLISPVSGKVVKINEELTDEPDRVNDELYDCWFLEIRADAMDDALMDEKTYPARKEEF